MKHILFITSVAMRRCKLRPDASFHTFYEIQYVHLEN
jgi:hypothetical protein